MRDAEEVAREALGCEVETVEPGRTAAGTRYCGEHRYPWLRDVDMCPKQERLAGAIRARDAEVRAETLAQIDEFAILLAATREGLARSGSKAKGVQQVVEMLAEHAGSIYTAAQAAHYRQRPPWREDRGKAASEALSWKPEPNRDQEDR